MLRLTDEVLKLCQSFTAVTHTTRTYQESFYMFYALMRFGHHA